MVAIEEICTSRVLLSDLFSSKPPHMQPPIAAGTWVSSGPRRTYTLGAFAEESCVLRGKVGVVSLVGLGREQLTGTLFWMQSKKRRM
jgi:hypothetical protein